MLEQEDLGREILVHVKPLFRRLSKLPIPKPKKGYNVQAETWRLEAEPLHISVDLSPRITAMAGEGIGIGVVGERKLVDFVDPVNIGLLDLDALYVGLLEYKSSRGYGNIYLPRSEIASILKNNDLYMPQEDQRDPQLLKEGAMRVLMAYLDRFVAQKEREAESQHLEPGSLVVREKLTPYTVRVSSAKDTLLKEIEALVRKPTLFYSDGGKPLPRLHIDRHLFSPLLLSPEDYKLEGVSVSPPGLGESEAKLLRDLRDFWKKEYKEEPYRYFEIFLLRNLPRVGVGFFRRSGFYPDFILWIKDKREDRTHIQFIEPHGLHHGGLQGNQDKFDALKDLKELSKERSFKKKKITMSGFVLTQTRLKDIPDAKDKSWEELERDYPILRQEREYIEKVLGF